MNRLENVRADVKKLYKASSNECMRTWFFENHVQLVAEYGKEISIRIDTDSEIVILSALLHDIARTWDIKKDPNLMNESLNKAEELMKKYCYSDTKIKQVKDAILHHSCRKTPPKTKEGKALATADALAHLMTDFYIVLPFSGWVTDAKDFEGYKKWASEKIERDFKKKIFFSYYKKLAKKRYEALKVVFSK